MISEAAAAQGRHGILALARPLVDVTSRIDFALKIPSLARHSHFMLDDVVVRLQLVVTDGPVFQGRSHGNRARPVAPRGFRTSLEIPWIQPPALRPIVDRRSSHRVHHGMNLSPPRWRGRPIAYSRNLAIRLRHRR